MTLYKLDQLSWKAAGRTILDIDHLEIEQGKIYALLGPNGAGKTTLLNILGFLEKPSSGSLWFKGKRVSFSEHRLRSVRRAVVMVNQRPILFTTSIYKNIEFGLKIRKIPKSRRAIIIEEALSLVGMKHLIHTPANRLSGGETQRVVLARALALSPEVILCDEPTSSIDLENQLVVVELLKRINAEKKISIVFTSHDRSQTLALANRTLFIDKGKISNAFYDNLFSVVTEKTASGDTRCYLNRRVVLIVSGEEREKNRVLINPEKIELSKDTENCYQVNQFLVTVSQISREGDQIRLIVTGDIRLTILLPTDVYQTLRLFVGEVVSIRIKDDAFRFLFTI